MSVSEPYAKELGRQVDELETENAGLRAEIERLQNENNILRADVMVAYTDEMGRLRTALQSIAANTCCDRCQEAALVARAALEGEMIEPQEADIGRRVVYTGNRYPGGLPEVGCITSINPHAVFVRYGDERHAKATSREDLEWADTGLSYSQTGGE